MLSFRKASEKEVVVQTNFTSNASELKFEFEKVLDGNAKQCEVHNALSTSIIQDVVSGYNCTLYLYGSHGSGRNHTMFGDKNSIATAIDSLPSIKSKGLHMDDSYDFGIIPRMAIKLFDYLKIVASNHTVRVSYLEILNDELTDLLGNVGARSGLLKVYENVKGQVIVNGLTELAVGSALDLLNVLQMGQDRLESHINSKQSHTILTLNVQLKEIPKHCDAVDDSIKFSRLSFVQLASTENSAAKLRAKAVQSLASFNRVVQALIDKQSHIPYRDSKLTRIMQESLGGNTKTSIIATVAPAMNSIEETIQTFELMARIKCIYNKPRINEILSKSITINEVTGEISQLMRDIEANKNKEGILLNDEEYYETRNQLELGRSDLRRRLHELNELEKEYESVDDKYSDADSNLCALSKKVALLRQMKEMQDQQLKNVKVANVERDAIIAKHIQTEQSLTEQLHYVQESITSISSDVSKLHGTIDVRRTVDKDLDAMSNDFFSEMQLLMGNMCEYSRNNEKVFLTIAGTHRAIQG